MSDEVLRVALADAESMGLISLKDAAAAADVTTLTATKRLRGVGLLGPDAPVVALGVRETAGRPARLFERAPALEAVLNSVGQRRTPAERNKVDLDLAPAATEADAALAEIAGLS